MTYNRATKTITADLVNHDQDRSERLFERSTISEQPDGKVVHSHVLFDHQGVKTIKKEAFLIGINRLLKTVKFSQFEAES